LTTSCVGSLFLLLHPFSALELTPSLSLSLADQHHDLHLGLLEIEAVTKRTT